MNLLRRAVVTFLFLSLSFCLTGCASEPAKAELKEVTLTSEEKNAIASFMEFNCFINYDSEKPEDEKTALFLTIGPSCGCWSSVLKDAGEKMETYYYSDESRKYIKDPLKAFKPDDTNGIAGYTKYDGETVDKLLRALFNIEPTHAKTPTNFECDLNDLIQDSGTSLRYYYHDGYYYVEETYGLCGNEGYGISFKKAVSDGTTYYIEYKRQYGTWLDEITKDNPESGDINYPVETAYATLKKNSLDGRECWSVVRLSDEGYFDFSGYAKDKPDEKWKELYIKQINRYASKTEFSHFSLDFIDGDDIPELIAESYTTAGGGELSTVYNGKLSSMTLDTCGASYIERKNLLRSQGGHMDSYYDEIYKIDKGKFIKQAEGTYGLDENFDYNDYSGGEITDYYSYYWADKKVSAEQYSKKLNKAFDTSRATDPYSCTLSASTILFRLKNDFYEVYPVNEDEEG